MDKIRIILVDDHDLVRMGVRRLMDDVDEIEIVGEGGSGEEAVELTRSKSPDVVLMDLNMPGIGGLEATKKLKHINPDIKILIVTMVEDVLFPQRLLKAGASGYITKGASVSEILHAMREVLAGRRYVSPEIAQRMALSKSGDDRSPFDELSERELQVMMMLMDGHRVNDISEKLCLSPKTVSTYRYRLYDKLGVSNDVELARLAMQHGMILSSISH